MNSVPEPVSQRRVDPDPSITSAIGRHHSLPTAIADLVDNSIDADANRVLIRFVTEGGHPRGLEVIDDGCGMDTATIDEAMEYGHRRVYADGDLGHFGIGLKAASLSQAETLMVWSRRYGAPAVGRRIRRDSIDTGPIVESYETADAKQRLDAFEADFDLDSGTVVEWVDVRTFLQGAGIEEQQAWMSSTIHGLSAHLRTGVPQAHRARCRTDLHRGVRRRSWSGRAVTGSAARTTLSIESTGATGYPAEIPVRLGGGTIVALCPCVASP